MRAQPKTLCEPDQSRSEEGPSPANTPDEREGPSTFKPIGGFADDLLKKLRAR